MASILATMASWWRSTASQNTRVVVDSPVFDALREQLGEEEILELTYITCTYDMHATISKALRLKFDDVDDPITEVAAPEGSSADSTNRADGKTSSG